MNHLISRPELLAPAGDLERLQFAVKYGADAVYLAGEQYGMRTSPSNFSWEHMRNGIDFAHRHGKRVYCACNILPRNREIKELPRFIAEAADCGVDAFVVSDLGVLNMVKKAAPNIPVHISTQAGIVNYAAANAFYELGASRVILARELSLMEIAELKSMAYPELEIECFVHGSMCVSFSGRCLLSDYLTGRDPNRGDCAQPCRWKYALTEEKRPNEFYPIFQDEHGTHILNAYDLCMIEHMPELMKVGITSFKIEGRAKSAYYTAVVSNAYRCAIDGFLRNPVADYMPESWVTEEINKVSHRTYGTGFFFGRPEKAQNYENGGYIREYDIVAVTESWDGEYLTAIQRNRFFRGDELEALEPSRQPYRIQAEVLLDENGSPLESAPHPMMKLKIRCSIPVPSGTILRKRK